MDVIDDGLWGWCEFEWFMEGKNIFFFMKPTGNFVLLEEEKKKQKKKIRIKFKKKFIDTKN